MNPQNSNSQPLTGSNNPGDPSAQTSQPASAQPNKVSQVPSQQPEPNAQAPQPNTADPFPPPFQPPATPQQSPAQTQQAYQQPSQQPETHQEFGQTVQYGVQKPQRSYKKLAIISAILVAIFGVTGALALTMSGQKDATEPSASTQSVAKSDQIEEKTVEIPSDWVVVPTELGFSIKAPDGWQAGVPTDSTIANLKSSNSLVSDPAANSSGGLLPPEDSVTVSSQERTDAEGQEAFESIVKKLNEESLSALEALGIKREGIKISSRNVLINDEEWLEVSTEIPGQFSRTLYLWDADRAIAVTVVAANKEKLSELSDKYLYPVAASMPETDADVDAEVDTDAGPDSEE